LTQNVKQNTRLAGQRGVAKYVRQVRVAGVLQVSIRVSYIGFLQDHQCHNRFGPERSHPIPRSLNQ
jgi:hypothetical protein